MKKRLISDRENALPHLAREGYEVSSIETWKYNCIAFAAGDEEHWWWPIRGHWPEGVKRELAIPRFIEAYETKDYRVCKRCSGWAYFFRLITFRDTGPHILEHKYEKIAIFVLNGEPTHAAIQLSDGRWKSKLGPWEDIEHNTIKAVEDHIYGKAVVFMSRERRNANQPTS
jgi:hypothetical protein